MGANTLVSGTIHFPAGTESFSGAVVTVQLQDTSQADAPVTVVTQQIKRHVDYDGAPIPFDLTGTLPADNDDRSRYNIVAHVSLHGGGPMQSGDYITQQSYPVLTHGHPNHITINVQPV